MSTNRVIITGGPHTGKSVKAEGIGEVAPSVLIRSSDDLLPDDPLKPRKRELDEIVKEQRRVILELPERERWSAMSDAIATTWLVLPGPWCFEGVAMPRAMRKWLKAHAEGRPCDRLVWLSKVYKTDQPRLPGHNAMAAQVFNTMSELVPELRKRGVTIIGWDA